ncbi:Prenyltransferase family protein [Flavobacterium indicum GPTSA100-9 = DSM 17447]|uniref:Prenyltransferase family protein n=1 Tax=Flavobacterium indicum (strain DSM 17447 / CIP 109464 / GPTSA100-9) TaxID=1094466 RepID=H8XQV3_FLAIG|nr:geranylgeranylglycerol-phosphate geranylgeranyltransferase [Flavobacterium indicum]CCG53401.1 Prenyltransferase family protein [Flavobacterium indicum GPTSA100-9 = DSM 17447]
MKNFLKLIRIENLVMIALMQIIVRYTFINNANLFHGFSNLNYTLLIIATLCIAAAGYIINDIYDVNVDYINKPDKVFIGNTISEKTAFNWYFALNILGVVIGVYLSNQVNRSALASIFVICSALLYIYSNGLKQIPLIGNAIVALLASSSIIVIILFNIFPYMLGFNNDQMLSIIHFLLNYVVMAFLIHFAREIVKTIEDYEGDKAYEITTAATYFGINVSKIITAIILAGLLVFMGYFIYNNIYHLTYVLFYFIVTIITPILFVIVKLFQAKEKADFTFISKLLKVIMLTIMLSLTAIVFIGS